MKIMKISEFKEIFNSACTEEQRNERGKKKKENKVYDGLTELM